jgi:hypothetical protein
MMDRIPVIVIRAPIGVDILSIWQANDMDGWSIEVLYTEHGNMKMKTIKVDECKPFGEGEDESRSRF